MTIQNAKIKSVWESHIFYLIKNNIRQFSDASKITKNQYFAKIKIYVPILIAWGVMLLQKHIIGIFDIESWALFEVIMLYIFRKFLQKNPEILGVRDMAIIIF